MVLADLCLLPPPLGDAEAAALHHHVEIHTVNARGRVVLQAKVDVLIDTKAEVAGGAAETKHNAPGQRHVLDTGSTSRSPSLELI